MTDMRETSSSQGKPLNRGLPRLFYKKRRELCKFRVANQ
jgi:hypothetical protein